MLRDKKDILKIILDLVRFFAVPAVVIMIINMVVLIVISFYKLSGVIKFMITHNNMLDISVSEVSADLLLILDVYLLIIVFYIMAIAIYKFFINSVSFNSWLKIETLSDLKIHIASVIVLFLIIFAVKKLVEWIDYDISLLYFGMVITILCAVLIWYCASLSRNKENKSLDKT